MPWTAILIFHSFRVLIHFFALTFDVISQHRGLRHKKSVFLCRKTVKSLLFFPENCMKNGFTSKWRSAQMNSTSDFGWNNERRNEISASSYQEERAQRATGPKRKSLEGRFRFGVKACQMHEIGMHIWDIWCTHDRVAHKKPTTIQIFCCWNSLICFSLRF